MENLGIQPNEQEAAAMYFAMSNCCALDLTMGLKNIRQAYYQASGIVEMETGVSLDAEKRDWLEKCKKAKPKDYVATEWAEVKKNWVL